MADRIRHLRQLAARPALARSRLTRRFTRADDGAVAVEFAFVAIPFLLLVFGIIELGLVFLVSMSLENAMVTVDRRIRTGELKNATPQEFTTAVCNEMPWLRAGCSDAITLDVRVLPSFVDAKTLQRPLNGATCFDTGGANSIMLVRGYYKWPLISPLMQQAIGGSTGEREVTFAAVFVNEPYSQTPEPIKCK